jgi:hypothetical protein
MNGTAVGWVCFLFPATSVCDSGIKGCRAYPIDIVLEELNEIEPRVFTAVVPRVIASRIGGWYPHMISSFRFNGMYTIFGGTSLVLYSTYLRRYLAHHTCRVVRNNQRLPDRNVFCMRISAFVIISILPIQSASPKLNGISAHAIPAIMPPWKSYICLLSLGHGHGSV